MVRVFEPLPYESNRVCLPFFAIVSKRAANLEVEEKSRPSFWHSELAWGKTALSTLCFLGSPFQTQTNSLVFKPFWSQPNSLETFGHPGFLDFLLFGETILVAHNQIGHLCWPVQQIGSQTTQNPAGNKPPGPSKYMAMGQKPNRTPSEHPNPH